MNEHDFKKLLIDLDLTRTEVARSVKLSSTGVRKYFQGRLRDRERRAQIKHVLQRRAREKGVRLPSFWQDRKQS